MSVTYPTDAARPAGEPAPVLSEETFVPVYARTRKSTRSSGGKVKTWMILAPIGVIVLGGIAAALVMTPGADDAFSSAPLSEPAATAPVLPATPAPAVETVAPAASVAAPAPAVVTPAPVVREAAPARRIAPAPAARRAAPAATPRVQAPAAQPTAPQPYTAPTSTLNSAPPTPAPAPAPTTAPPIVVAPL